MSELTIADLLGFADKLTVIIVLVVVIYGGYRKWWVFGWAYQAKVEECEQWQSMELRSVGVAETVTDTVQPLTAKGRPQ